MEVSAKTAQSNHPAPHIAPRVSGPSDRTIYFILCDFGRHGRAYVERDAGDMDRKTTIRDIADRQFSNIVQILECNPAEHICSDVTEEILGAAELAMEAA